MSIRQFLTALFPIIQHVESFWLLFHYVFWALMWGWFSCHMQGWVLFLLSSAHHLVVGLCTDYCSLRQEPSLKKMLKAVQSIDISINIYKALCSTTIYKIITIVSTLGLWHLHPWTFDQDYITRDEITSCWAGLKYTQKVVIYLISLSSIVPVGIPSLTGWHCSM